MLVEKKSKIKEIKSLLQELSIRNDLCSYDEYLMNYNLNTPQQIGKNIMLGFNLPNVLVPEILIRFKKDYTRLPIMKVETLNRIIDCLKGLLLQ